MYFRHAYLLHLSVVLLFCGCGDSERDASHEALVSMSGGELKATVAVSGKVLFDGQPTSKVTIYAYSKGGTFKKPDFECVTKQDGTYCWNTYVECDGLPVGEYQLAFKKSGPRAKPGAADEWGGKYTNPKTADFLLKVEAGKPQVDVNYELTK